MAEPTIVYPKYPAPASQMTLRNPQQIVEAIVHHGDDDPMEDPLAIDAQHRKQGWAMVGYSWLINKAGTIFKGRPDKYWPSAAYGENPQSVDICLMGDFQPGTTGAETSVPDAQLTALKYMLVLVHQQYPNIRRTIGHRDVAKDFPLDPSDYSTACPGDVLYALLPELRVYVSQQLQTLRTV